MKKRDILLKLFSEYVERDKVLSISDTDTALKYMLDAMNYAIQDLGEASKYDKSNKEDIAVKHSGAMLTVEPQDSPGPFDPHSANYASFSDVSRKEVINDYQMSIISQDPKISQNDNNRFKCELSAWQMLCSFAACVFYIKENNSSLLDSLSLNGINWKALSLVHRNLQYNPNFHSGLNYSEKFSFIADGLHSALEKGELNQMVENLDSFLTDKRKKDSLIDRKEEIIEELQGLKNLKKNENDDDKVKEYNLRSQELAEDLRKTQADLKNYNGKEIKPVDVKILPALVGFLADEYLCVCIKDSVESLEKVELNSGAACIFLIRIGEALSSSSPVLKKIFDRDMIEYTESMRNLLCHAERPQESELIKSFLEGNEIFCSFNRDVSIFNLFKYWKQQKKNVEVFHSSSYGNVKKSWSDLLQELDNYKNCKQVKVKSGAESRLSKIEQNSINRIEDIEFYCDQHSKIKDKTNAEELSAWKDFEVSKAITHMLNNYLFYANKIVELKNIRDINEKAYFQILSPVLQDGTYTGALKPDNEKQNSLQKSRYELEFYQVMVGSVARGLLETKDKVDYFKNMMTNDLCKLLQDIIDSRSYLAHIGKRPLGKAFDESIDSSTVYFQGPNKVLESINSVEEIISEVLNTHKAFIKEIVSPLSKIVDNIVENKKKDVSTLKEFLNKFPILPDLVDNSEHVSLARWLVKNSEDNEYCKSEDTRKMLFEFVQSGNIEFVKYLVSVLGVSVNLTNAYSKVNALTIACEANNYEMVKFLLSKDVNFDSRSIIGITPIEAAADRIAREDGDIRILNALLDKYKTLGVESGGKSCINDILINVDIILQYGPTYIEDEYKQYVEKHFSHIDFEETGW